MSTHTFRSSEWGIILGGSSGFGLATAHKLSAHGLNLCLVHRDRRGAMRRIEPEFERIRDRNVRLLTVNTDALRDEAPGEILGALEDEMDSDDEVRVLLHSIAFGNLKLLCPPRRTGDDAAERLAEALDRDPDDVRAVADRLLEEGVDGVRGLAGPPEYPEGRYIGTEDVGRTVHAMGSSLLEWTQTLRARKMLAEDARVLGLTSEGSRVAWKGYAAVSAAKAVLEAISRNMALEMAPWGVRTNIVQAGVTDTRALRVIPGSRHLKAAARARNPFGRLTTPEDVADAIYLLCLPEASWINGALLRVDGGEAIAGSAQ